MSAKTIMFQGTASHVGKSILTAAMCHSLARRGYRVAPFKAQNMSLNSCVTFNGGEIGRSTAFQACAAGVAPTVDMNPVLLKPSSGPGAQVIINGHPVGTMDTDEYHAFQPKALEAIAASLAKLRREFDAVVLEGAGSPAEINLEGRDISNMRVAAICDTPVILIGDVERGGVFASLYGTWALLPERDRARICGMVINRMRGDAARLGEGPRLLEARTGVPVLGVVPYLLDLSVDEEDAVALDGKRASGAVSERQADIAVIRFPHISNFTDFSPLSRFESLSVRYVEREQDFGAPDLVILPGAKSTAADLLWLRNNGLADRLLAHTAHGGRVIGLCGGYQMLGRRILDPDKVDSGTPFVEGLGLLDVETSFAAQKALRIVEGVGAAGWLDGCRVKGYEIHHGVTHRGEAARPLVQLDGSHDGAIDIAGRVAGTYLHGLFDNPAVSAALCRELGVGAAAASGDQSDDVFERLADLVDSSLPMNAILALMGLTN